MGWLYIPSNRGVLGVSRMTPNTPILGPYTWGCYETCMFYSMVYWGFRGVFWGCFGTSENSDFGVSRDDPIYTPNHPLYMYPMYTVYSTPMCTCTYVPMYIGYYRYSTYRGVLLVVVYIGYHTPSTLCTIVPSTIGYLVVGSVYTLYTLVPYTLCIQCT